jgi:hypothetical protein
MIEFIGTSLQIQSIVTSHIELLLNDVLLTNPYEKSRTDLSLVRMHESAPFYNCHTARI